LKFPTGGGRSICKITPQAGRTGLYFHPEIQRSTINQSIDLAGPVSPAVSARCAVLSKR
jgi:hypothetical protein